MSTLGSFKAYKVTNTVTGQSYIGITKQKLANRWGAHIYWARSGRKGVLADAIREHGEVAFVMEHLASAKTWEDLCETELALIGQEGTLIWDGGYNVTQGGEGMHGYVMTESQRQAISDRMRGVPKSPEHRVKIALSKVGARASPETKVRLSASHKGKPHSEKWVRRQAETLIGRPKSPEHRAKLSAAKTGQKASAETKAKLSALKKGRKLNLTTEQRAERSARASARTHSAETRAKISAARRKREAKRTEIC